MREKNESGLTESGMDWYVLPQAIIPSIKNR